MSSTQARHLYRGLHREVRKIAKVGQGKAPPFNDILRQAFAKEDAHGGLLAASDVLLFLRSQRKYTELLERYNPGATMSQAERNRLTARRVGLNLPKDNSDDYYPKK